MADGGVCSLTTQTMTREKKKKSTNFERRVNYVKKNSFPYLTQQRTCDRKSREESGRSKRKKRKKLDQSS